jgi:homoserine O-acetyltransferase/O-succinyltransferase
VPLTGMRMARKLGMITYRSAEEWRQRFGRERATSEHAHGDPFGILFEVEAYLEHHANKFIGQFDPNCYLYLSRASDLFDVAEHGGSVEEGLAKVEAERVLVIGVTTDFLFPPYQQRELAELLERPGRKVEYAPLDCIKGHDSFLVEMDSFRPVISRFFAR